MAEKRVPAGVSESDLVLLGPKPPVGYSPAEQQFSCLLQDRLDHLLRGKQNCFALMRQYHKEPGRIGICSTPAGLDVRQLRFEVVENLLRETLSFLHDGRPGGPVSRCSGGNGHHVEGQLFATKWPHILILRVDLFADDNSPLETLWSARRVQNQRSQIRINRALDMAALGIDLLRLAGIAS